MLEDTPNFVKLSAKQVNLLRVKNRLKGGFDFFLLCRRALDRSLEKDRLKLGGEHGNQVKEALGTNRHQLCVACVDQERVENETNKWQCHGDHRLRDRVVLLETNYCINYIYF